MSSQVVDEEEQKQEEDFAGENVDEEDEQQQQRSRQAGRRKKRAARELFNESGQTDSERRVLRKNQRSLYDRLANDQRDATAAAAAEPDDNDDNNDESLQFLGSLRDENNRLWKNVRYTREAVLDADNVDLITNKYVQHVDRLVQVPRYDPLRLVQKLLSSCTQKSDTSQSSYFDWRGLGQESGICFNAVPSQVSFWAGTLDRDENDTVLPKKQRRKRATGKDEEAEEVRPEQMDKQKTTADQLSAGEKTMKVMKKKLHERCQQALEDPETHLVGGYSDCGVDGLRYLVNPKSFTQTVENIFHFSFMVKRGLAEIGFHDPSLDDSDENSENSSGRKRHKGKPGLYVKTKRNTDEVDNPTKQSVLSLNINQWKALVEAYELKEGDLPHRSTSRKGALKKSFSSPPTSQEMD